MALRPLWRTAGDLMGYVLLFREAPESHRPDLPALRSHLLGLVDAFGRELDARQHPQDELDEARFALVAWIDEMINTSTWSARDDWKKEPLQLQLFRTVRAGNEFFEHLRGLRPDQNSAREVYFLCLALGFVGETTDPGARRQLIQEQYDQLRVSGRALEVAREVPFMPPAYDLAIQLPDLGGSGLIPKLLLLSVAVGGVFGAFWTLLNIAAGKVPLPPT
jgi:type VI secretion system protein ImpK